jgi:hypothetical protein
MFTPQIVTLAGRHAVQGVSGHGAELGRFQVQHPFADLLVAGEDDLHRSVSNGRVLHEGAGHFHDDREAGLIVGAE